VAVKYRTDLDCPSVNLVVASMSERLMTDIHRCVDRVARRVMFIAVLVRSVDMVLFVCECVCV